MSRLLSVWEVCWVLVVVVGLPNWYRSVRFGVMGSKNGGWLRVVGFFWFCLDSELLMFPICGRSSIRAFWSPYSGVWVANLCLVSCSVWLY